MGSVELDTAERLSAHKVYGKIFFSSDGSKIKTFVRFRVPVIDFSLLIFNYFILLIWRALVSRRKCYVQILHNLPLPDLFRFIFYSSRDKICILSYLKYFTNLKYFKNTLKHILYLTIQLFIKKIFTEYFYNPVTALDIWDIV